jgi:hypothetical protein
LVLLHNAAYGRRSALAPGSGVSIVGCTRRTAHDLIAAPIL